jgi:hypothetical protein
VGIIQGKTCAARQKNGDRNVNLHVLIFPQNNKTENKRKRDEFVSFLNTRSERDTEKKIKENTKKSGRGLYCKIYGKRIHSFPVFYLLNSLDDYEKWPLVMPIF